MTTIDVAHLTERLWQAGLNLAAASATAAGIAEQDDARAHAGLGDTAAWQTWRLAPGVYVHVYVTGDPPAVPLTSTGVML